MKPTGRSPEPQPGANSVADLFNQHAGAVYGYLLRLSGDRSCADELTNETFLRAMIALDGFRGESTVKTWLLRIARNLYLNRVKKEKRETSLDGLMEQGMTFPGSNPGPEERTLEQERFEDLQRGLLTLSESDRSILLLASQEKLSYREIGQVLGISVAAVKVRIFRARQRLAKTMEHKT